MSYQPPEKITSIQEAIGILEGFKGDIEQHGGSGFSENLIEGTFPWGLWFRGENRDYDPPLLPKVFRKRNGKGIMNEPSATNHIPLRVPELYTTNNEFDKLFLAQHYYIPTRLLDWTESILVALFFATISNRKLDDGSSIEEKDGFLYILNAYRLNKMGGMGDAKKKKLHTPSDFGALFRAYAAFSHSPKEWARRISNNTKFDWNLLKDEDPVFGEKYKNCSKEDFQNGKQFDYFTSPIAVIPSRIKTRMLVQSSMVTIFGGSFSFEEHNMKHEPKSLPLPHETNDKFPVYYTVKIPADRKMLINRNLFSLGIHKGMLFPELDQQDDYIDTIW